MDTTPLARPAPLTLGASFKDWLKVGFISFGGPAGGAGAPYFTHVQFSNPATTLALPDPGDAWRTGPTCPSASNNASRSR